MVEGGPCSRKDVAAAAEARGAAAVGFAHPGAEAAVSVCVKGKDIGCIHVSQIPLYGVILLFRQAVLLPVLLGGNTVLLFECPEKAGVVLEAVLEIHMADGLVGQYGVLAGVKPFFQDVLVEWNAHVVLKYVGDMVFAHIEKGRQAVQAQILLQVPVDVVTDVQVQDIFIDS